MIDLHIHTTSSDGSDEPIEILKKAQQAGLKYISITDHDSIGAYKKLKTIHTTSYFQGEIIPGCEFSVAYKEAPIEILGYGIDLETISSTGVISDEKFLERENSYLDKMKAICRNLGAKFSDDLSITKGKFYATQIMHTDLRSYPDNEKILPNEIWESINSFYRTCVTNRESPFFLDQMKDYPTLQEATELIRKAGGKSFLAHLYGYFVKDYMEFLDSIISQNALDGVECYHPLHSMDRTKQLLDYCKSHNLQASGGSDYHGILKPNVKIGECQDSIRIPYEILEPWLANIR